MARDLRTGRATGAASMVMGDGWEQVPIEGGTIALTKETAAVTAATTTEQAGEEAMLVLFLRGDDVRCAVDVQRDAPVLARR